MAWGKIDDRLHSSLKWQRANKGARALWITSLSWCMSELTDGFVPADLLGYLGGTRADARVLVGVRLWDEADGGYQFHDWLDYQPAREQVLAEREAAAERQRRAREKAREKRLAGEGVTGEVTRDSRRESRSPRPDPTRPDPTPISNGSPDLGGEPKRRARFAPQECGREHDPADPCGACGAARRRQKDAERAEADRIKAEAKAKAERNREIERAEREARKAEEAATLAEIEAWEQANR